MSPTPVPAQVDPRTLHFGVFYGVREPVTDAPVLLVHGNCQAESVRILLDAGDVERSGCRPCTNSPRTTFRTSRTGWLGPTTW